VTSLMIHALEKPLYSSFFKKNTKYKAEFNRINKPLRQIIDCDKLNKKADESHERKLVDKTSVINSTLKKNYHESVIKKAINDHKKVQNEINKKVKMNSNL